MLRKCLTALTLAAGLAGIGGSAAAAPTVPEVRSPAPQLPYTINDGFACSAGVWASVDVYSVGATTITLTGSNPTWGIGPNTRVISQAAYAGGWGKIRHSWSGRIYTQNSWLSIQVRTNESVDRVQILKFCGGRQV